MCNYIRYNSQRGNPPLSIVLVVIYWYYFSSRNESIEVPYKNCIGCHSYNIDAKIINCGTCCKILANFCKIVFRSIPCQVKFVAKKFRDKIVFLAKSNGWRCTLKNYQNKNDFPHASSKFYSYLSSHLEILQCPMLSWIVNEKTVIMTSNGTKVKIISCSILNHILLHY